jgi:hypothetical protein
VPHSGQKLAASSRSCAPQFGQDSSSCSVCSSVNALFSLAPGVPFRVGYIPMRVEAKAWVSEKGKSGVTRRSLVHHSQTPSPSP